MEKGIAYYTLYLWFTKSGTPNFVLERDFARFKQDGVNYIRIHLIWSRLEGPTQGDFTGSNAYGDAVLEDVKRLIGIANQYGIQTMVVFHTLWNESWCTPEYVIDPYEGKCRQLAIVRSEEMRQAFINMFTHTVNALKGTPGIWCWAINEPWYYPKTLPPPFENIDQKENFITLFQELNDIIKVLDGRDFTINFVCIHDGKTFVTNIFDDNWNWDDRIFQTIDFMSFNIYYPSDANLLPYWLEILHYNFDRASLMKGPIWITEFGVSTNSNAEQVGGYRSLMSLFKTLPCAGVIPHFWRGDGPDPNWEPYGVSYNLCADINGNPRPAYYVFTETTPPPPGPGAGIPTTAIFVGGLLVAGIMAAALFSRGRGE